MCTKRLKGEPDQILLGKYYLELGKNTEYNRKRWCIYLHLCAFHLFLEYYSMFMFPIMKVIEKYVSYMSINKNGINKFQILRNYEINFTFLIIHFRISLSLFYIRDCISQYRNFDMKYAFLTCAPITN